MFFHESDFNTFILPYLKLSKLGRKPKIKLHKIFNYILHWLHTGCQWESLKRVIDKNKDGKLDNTETAAVIEGFFKNLPATSGARGTRRPTDRR